MLGANSNVRRESPLKRGKATQSVNQILGIGLRRKIQSGRAGPGFAGTVAHILKEGECEWARRLFSLR